MTNPRESLRSLIETLPDKQALLLCLVGRILDLEAMAPEQAEKLVTELTKRASKRYAELSFGTSVRRHKSGLNSDSSNRSHSPWRS